jgi:ABC-type Zn uptake system ZnuABC Zn-binding protein ZnuA/ABC-type Mn2+/Zn2+ transport system permease subunit
MLDSLSQPYIQRALLELAFLSVAGGVFGTWIVLRGLAFYSHAVGTAAFPGLVLAEGLGFAAPLGGFAAAGAFALAVAGLAGRRRTGYDSLTALVLVGCLSLGVVLASDVFHSGSSIDTLLFGSLLLIDGGDVAFAAAAAALVLLASVTLGQRWLVVGFDPDGAGALGARSALPDLALLVVVAVATTAALTATGALLTTALFIVPAATTRLFVRRLPGWRVATVALLAAEGFAGVLLADSTNTPPGAAIAVISGGVFALAAIARIAPRRALAVGAAGALLAVAGCGDGAAAGGERLEVVATTTQIGDFARQVGGNDVQVTQILQPNTDPHEYEPRPSDVKATAKAKVAFQSGDNLDAWMSKVVDDSGADLRPVDLGAIAPVKLPGETEGDEASRYDPHWWHDPRNAEAAVKRIRDALAKADPSKTAAFDGRAEAYLGSLEALDEGIERCFAKVPASKRKLVTDHDAFNYFTERYGIEVIGAVIPSQTTQAQPSAGDLAELSAVIRREGVKAVYPESSLNAKLAEAIARQTGATARYTLYGDTLGPDGSPGATYMGMERANADAMVRGFSGGSQGCSIAGIR